MQRSSLAFLSLSRFVGLTAAGAIALGVATIACDGSGSPPAASPGGSDAGVAGSDGGGGFGLFDGGGLRPMVGGAGGTMEGPPPMPNPTAVRLPFPARARLIGVHQSACTNFVPDGDAPQTQDRWCGFYVNGEILGSFELWVFNLSQAVREPGSVTCNRADGTHCKRLTTNLWTGQPQGGPSHPFSHAFEGDTLIYYADAVSAADALHKGPVYAWRPGWQQPRRITGQSGILCNAHYRGGAATCLTNIEEDATRPLTFDLHAGVLRDSDDAVLPKIDRILPSSMSGQDGVTKWRAGYTRNGDYFVYSTARVEGGCAQRPEACENIRAIPTATLVPGYVYDPMAATPIVTDGSRWALSRDGQRIYYLSGYNYSRAGDPSGTLRMASFPSGASPATVSDKVGAYIIMGREGQDVGVAYFWDVTASKGSLRLMDDPTQPAAFSTISSNIASALLSGDQRYSMISRNIDNTTGLADLFLVDIAKARAGMAGAECTLQAGVRTDVYGTPFLRNSGLVFWTDDVDTQVFVGKGMLARTSDCMGRQQFATDVDFWFAVGDRGMIYSDSTNLDEVSVRYAEITSNTWPSSGGSLVQARASRLYSMSLPDYGTLLFQINSNSPTAGGIYVYRLPFGGAPASPDGGAPDAGAGGDTSSD